MVIEAFYFLLQSGTIYRGQPAEYRGGGGGVDPEMHLDYQFWGINTGIFSSSFRYLVTL